MSPGQALEFSAAEMRRRRAAFGRELERSGASYALVYGANRSGSAVSWLTGWPVTREALLVVAPAPEDDVLLVSFFNHVPQARRLSVTRVESAGPRAVTTALDLIAARGRLPARIGVAGALPFDQYRLLAGQVLDVVDLNPASTGLRLVKSGEELAALRRGAALSDAGIAALADALRPGATDYEVLARTELAYTAQGGLHHIHYLGLTAMDEPAMDEPALAVPAQWPTGRVIRPRDVASCEISARSCARSPSGRPRPRCTASCTPSRTPRSTRSRGTWSPAPRPASWPKPRPSSGRPASPRLTTWCTASAAATSRRWCRLLAGRYPRRTSRWRPG